MSLREFYMLCYPVASRVWVPHFHSDSMIVLEFQCSRLVPASWLCRLDPWLKCNNEKEEHPSRSSLLWSEEQLCEETLVKTERKKRCCICMHMCKYMERWCHVATQYKRWKWFGESALSLPIGSDIQNLWKFRKGPTKARELWSSYGKYQSRDSAGSNPSNIDQPRARNWSLPYTYALGCAPAGKPWNRQEINNLKKGELGFFLERLYNFMHRGCSMIKNSSTMFSVHDLHAVNPWVWWFRFFFSLCVNWSMNHILLD